MPGALPGERVRAAPIGTRARQPIYGVEAWLRRSPDRVEPACPHFGTCGGCAVQHLQDGAYARWKVSILAEALDRAGFSGAAITPLARTPVGARRRADFALTRSGTRAVGFHARRSGHTVDLSACPVLHAELFALVAPLRALLGHLECLRHTGSAIVNLLDHGADLLLRTEAAPGRAERDRLITFARENGLVRASWAPPRGEAEPLVQLQPASITLSGHAVTAPPGAFLQASAAGEAAILAALLAGLPADARRFADLYAGLGTLSFALAARGSVAAFEGDRAATAALGAAAGGTRVQVTCRDLARQPLSPAELEGFDAIVLDPPFAGAPAQIGAIAASAVAHVAYVSCNTSALARDGRLLQTAGFELASAAPIDQFLWSPHLECVLHFVRPRRRLGPAGQARRENSRRSRSDPSRSG